MLDKSYKTFQKMFGARSKQTKPTQILLETTNHCNLNCPFCLVGMQNDLIAKHGSASHDLMSRPLGTMTQETFDRVLEQIKAFGVRKVYMHFQGEPFINNNTPKFAKALKQAGMYVGVFTNGLAFTEKKMAEAVDAEYDLIRFSVDGATEDVYQKNRVGGKFGKVYENMATLVRLHKEAGKKTRLEWQFIALRNNEHEVEMAREMAKRIGINFFVKGFRETDPALAPTNPALRSKFAPKPCRDIYLQIGIYWNGDVVPCCYDTDGKEIMGNVLKEDLETVWINKKYQEFRHHVDNFKKYPENDPDICKTCLRWR